MVNTYADHIALLQYGFSKPVPAHLVPSQAAKRLIDGCRSSGHFLPLLEQLNGLEVWYSIIAMYQFVFDIVAPRSCIPATLRESPIVYFFVKYCLDQGMGVPGPILGAYHDMRKQLSCSFLRCANPTCEHNKLDKSAGKTKFKQCSRCQSVIYCSRECQVAHYPEHKVSCRKAISAQKSADQATEHALEKEE